ncbi:hypothetical protein [Paraburkholderia caribensis]|uniref:hypothetical protein n=1 Tax=Paraburkholderia caribensis TaxID=75105 RepID=UPI0007227DAE|nr:hypothetical protein [Paraburkholderia caribensis]ALP62813.1 hypothetical protein AN416_09535 [Paraburkholderia caribensis]AUT51956.1 hypothetical protein C2L66_08865 [Paraburkholderia caribensis]
MAKLGQRAFARHVGVTLRAVQKAIQSGRIAVDTDGKIDADTAVAAWRRNTDESRRSITDQSRPSLGNAAFSMPSPPANPDDDVEEDDLPAAASKEDPSMVAYRAARAAREQTRLERERMDLERERGTTLPLADAQRLAFTAFRTVRDNVMNIPVRLKDALAAESDPTRVESMLETELTRALASVDATALLRENDTDDDDGSDRSIPEEDYGGNTA